MYLKVRDLFSCMEIQVKGVEEERDVLLVVHVSALVQVCVPDSVGIAELHAIRGLGKALEGWEVKGSALVGVGGIADVLRGADLPRLQVAQAALHPPFGQELIAIGDSEGLVEADRRLWIFHPGGQLKGRVVVCPPLDVEPVFCEDPADAVGLRQGVVALSKGVHVGGHRVLEVFEIAAGSHQTGVVGLTELGKIFFFVDHGNVLLF